MPQHPARQTAAGRAHHQRPHIQRLSQSPQLLAAAACLAARLRPARGRHLAGIKSLACRRRLAACHLAALGGLLCRRCSPAVRLKI